MTIVIYDESMICLMFDKHQPNQLCGPDGGFTSAGRDSLLFQVGNLSYSVLQVFTAKILFFWYSQKQLHWCNPDCAESWTTRMGACSHQGLKLDNRHPHYTLCTSLYSVATTTLFDFRWQQLDVRCYFIGRLWKDQDSKGSLAKTVERLQQGEKNIVTNTMMWW